MKRLTNYLFFLNKDFELERTIPIKNISGIYQEEEFVKRIFEGLLSTNPQMVKLFQRQKQVRIIESIELQLAIGILTMEIHPLEFSMQNNSGVLATFFEGKNSNTSIPEDSFFKNIRSIEYIDEFSHEIKNAVNIIYGISNLMNISGKDEAHELIPTLNKSTKHLKDLVTNYLFARKNENLRWERTGFNVEKEVETIIGQFEFQNKPGLIGINFRLDPRIPKTIIGCPVALRQVLINLVFNALDHAAGGAISIEVNLQKEDFDELILKYSVTDSGSGIPEEIIKNIFSGDQNPELKKNGFGLGLNICKEILNTLGSDLKVHTEIGKGSSFYFELSFNKPLPETSYLEILNSGHSPNLNFFDKRALIVDDDHLNRLVATKNLAKFGLHCESVPNGVLAMQKLHDTNFDIVILDIHLPLLDGFTLAHLIQRRFPNLKVVISTGNSDESVLDALKKMGVKSFLSKPYSHFDLWNILSQELT